MASKELIEANRLINQFIDLLYQTAGYGDKSYFYDMSKLQYVSPELSTNQDFTYSISIEKLIYYLNNKFPNCKITYQDAYGEKLKKGILIDWS
jgi:hypothetical protein